ncbi:multidrug effflux MFS transporter [Phaeovulum vinaykumarii]|uniref:Bcr/CflA family efflux transporter n=1 Tax=Phaeovulum vinaykumarii TaxID=407234 RepID=A0A1N7K5S7_9RHOB|nr:multidrug effflux MFS transporter [Phaeovulum vinaykumarii]SIS56975.1 MFS transporter, DHA1 family, bicyclomycin/chloramphenicol resistance protein [Phaeovulum vinaykumarii]SOB93226.1 DHA1 family bicyclomycin/chloramphenicol resistance-like MFS transporter [Phaeovulum vinaykumarii]
MTPHFLDRQSPPHIATLILLAGLAALSMNIFLPSLPGMARHFGVDYAVMQLSVSAYLGVSAALQLVIGPISDRYGRRVVILGALILFLLATAGTLLAPSAEIFLIARMAQAIIATGMALSRAVVRDMVPGPEAASMIGYVTMGMSVVPMIGPVLGGILDEAFGWQASFSLLLALGLAVTALVWADLGETAAPGGGGFAAQVRSYPALFASRRFWGYCLAATLSSGSFFAYLGGAPFVGAHVFGISPATLGYFFTAPAVGYSLGNFLSGRFSVRLGTDRMIWLGTLVATGALGLATALAVAGISHPLIFFPAVGVMALGNGMTLPNANAGMMSVRPELAGTASGLGGAMTIGGGAALAAVAGALLRPGGTETPLLALMTASSIASIAAIMWVRARRAALGV